MVVGGLWPVQASAIECEIGVKMHVSLSLSLLSCSKKQM